MADLVDYGLQSEKDLVRILYECFRNQEYSIQAGDVLVTLNPWKGLKEIEKEVVEFCRLYQGEKKHNTLPPHPCSVAENAVRDTSDGVIIPLGESGSGKSTNIEMILGYLSRRAHSKLPANEITAISEVFDLFCNAKTLICNNSTRCIKVYELCYSQEKQLLGVNVKIYALQKMRVVSQIKGEGNFNIYHRLLDGLSSEALQEYCLEGEHRYVPSLSTETLSERENSLSLSLKCLERIGLDEKEIEEVLHLISSIILLGDLQFGQASQRDVIAFCNGEVLEKAATLAGVPCSNLADLIIVKSKKVKGQKVNISASCSKAMHECDRIAVTLYETLVMWLAERINSRFTGHSRLQSDFSLVLLDIFGWENYSICSFEQLCINTVNEVLQSTYNAVIFTTYQMDLENENIFLHEPCLKFDQPGAVPLLLKPKGLLDILHSSVEKNDQKLSKKLDNLLKKEPRYIVNNQQDVSGFLIQHFIDEVLYDTNGFAADAQNWLNDNALSCLKASKNEIVSAMAQERINRENMSLDKALFTASLSSKKSGSIVEKNWLKTNVFLTNAGKDKKKHAAFKNSNTAVLTMSLTSLLKRISSAKIHFVRCINSNLGMQADVFDDERVLRQVQWSNLFGTVKTRISCLQSCFLIHQFITRYRLLFFYLTRPVPSSPDLCNSVLSRRFDESEFRVGRTKVFLKRNLVSQLEKMLEKALYYIVLIQKIYRGILGRRQYQAMVKIKKKYDDKRSLFLSQITKGVSKFHDHLSLQNHEDQRRLKQHKLKVPTYATSESLTWCKVICFQRTKQLALFSVKVPRVVIDGTNHSFTTDRIGFNSFPTPSHDLQMRKIKACIGRGVELYQSEDKNLIAIRLCKNSIYVKGHFCEKKLLISHGEMSKNEESVVFDYRHFMEKINYECHPARIAKDSEDKCLAMCVIHLCFVKNSTSDEDAPCWVEVVLSMAVQYVKGVISYSMQRRREVQEKCHFQEPPALRIDSKMESTSAKILKLIRPSRYIETVRFKRKKWARKRVVSNPFLYGESDSVDPHDGNDGPGVSSLDSTYNESSVVFEENGNVDLTQEICNSPEIEVSDIYENVDIRGNTLGASYEVDVSSFENTRQERSFEISQTDNAENSEDLRRSRKEIDEDAVECDLEKDDSLRNEVIDDELYVNVQHQRESIFEISERQSFDSSQYFQEEYNERRKDDSALNDFYSLNFMRPENLLPDTTNDGRATVHDYHDMKNTSLLPEETSPEESHEKAAYETQIQPASPLSHVSSHNSDGEFLQAIPQDSSSPYSSVSRDIPSPDYMDDDLLVYTNFSSIQEHEDLATNEEDLNEDVYEVMERSRHSVYDDTVEYVNSTDSRQYLRQS